MKTDPQEAIGALNNNNILYVPSIILNIHLKKSLQCFTRRAHTSVTSNNNNHCIDEIHSIYVRVCKWIVWGCMRYSMLMCSVVVVRACVRK